MGALPLPLRVYAPMRSTLRVYGVRVDNPFCPGTVGVTYPGGGGIATVLKG